MNLLFALLLGALQGATEFLPVSSSGHLVLAQHLLGIKQPGLFFEALLHMGSLAAVLIFYRNDIQTILVDFFRGAKQLIGKEQAEKRILDLEGIRIALFVCVASFPTMLIGLSLNDLLDPSAGTPLIGAKSVSAALLVNGCILFGYRWLTQPEESDIPPDGTIPPSQEQSKVTLWGMSLAHALIIGIAQGLAVMPGISRSGSTITTAIMLGVRRNEAARFSFLLSIPAIVGAFLLKLRELNLSEVSLPQWGIFCVGTLVAGVVGWLCLRWLVRLLKATKFYAFAYYCWAVGLFSLVFLLFR